MKPRIFIRLFGKFSFQCSGQDLFTRTAIRAQEILAYLILNRRTAVRRDRLAGLISNSSQPQGPRKDLRHYLWRLSAGLGALRSRVLRVEEEWIQFVPDDEVWVDVGEFERAAKDPTRHPLAVELYRDELLSGWDQEWPVAERERLRQIYLETLDGLIANCEARGDVPACVAYANLALQNDATRECTHQALMRVYGTSGDRHSALLQYERCREALKTLGVRPDAKTQELMKRIRRGRSDQVESEGSELQARFSERAAQVARAAGAERPERISPGPSLPRRSGRRS